MTQPKMRRRWPSKEAREIAAAVRKAGGTIGLTGKGHLRITGPAGIAVVPSTPETGRWNGRGMANAWAEITTRTGLKIPQQPRGGSGARHRGGRARRSLPPARRRGTVTSWGPGNPYGFITDPDGCSWFASRDSLMGGVLTKLPEGTKVTFTGSLAPKAGKRYPEAFQIQARTSS